MHRKLAQTVAKSEQGKISFAQITVKMLNILMTMDAVCYSFDSVSLCWASVPIPSTTFDLARVSDYSSVSWFMLFPTGFVVVCVSLSETP